MTHVLDPDALSDGARLLAPPVDLDHPREPLPRARQGTGHVLPEVDDPRQGRRAALAAGPYEPLAVPVEAAHPSVAQQPRVRYEEASALGLAGDEAVFG